MSAQPAAPAPKPTTPAAAAGGGFDIKQLQPYLPHLLGAAAGGIGGLVMGGGDKDSMPWWQRMLLGAGLGAGAGYGIDKLRQNPDVQAAVQSGVTGAKNLYNKHLAPMMQPKPAAPAPAPAPVK